MHVAGPAVSTVPVVWSASAAVVIFVVMAVVMVAAISFERDLSRRAVAGRPEGSGARAGHGGRRIAVIIGQLGWGGSERQMTLLVEQLCRARDEGSCPDVLEAEAGRGGSGDRIDVVCTSSSTEPYGPRIEAAGARLLVPFSRGAEGRHGLLAKLRRLWWLVAALRGLEPDVVLVYSVRNLVALAASFILRAPMVVTERSLGVWKSKAYLVVDRLLYRRSALIVANSEATRRFVVKHSPSAGPIARVVPNGIELLPVETSDVKTARVVRFSMVAGLRPWKNHRLLIDACVVLAAQELPFGVVLVGDGPLRAELERRIRAAGLEHHLELAGWQHDPLPIVRSCHVNLNLSTHESSPNAVLEAMMLGRPSIVTAVGGNPELVEDGVSGLVIPSGDRDALAKAMETLITHRTLALQLGAAARRAAERHSIEHMVEGMSQCLDEAILAASRLPGGHRA